MPRPHRIEQAQTAASPSVPALALTTAVLYVVFLVALASSALGAPAHPPLAGETVTGLDDACGAATDPAGDLYVASAGEGKIEVLDPERHLLKTISNADEPCGLAVDSTGRLYVSEKATGNVVRYTPDAYPLSASPSYGAAEPIDESGAAKGIAVDRSDDNLYVAEGTRISVYGPDGELFQVADEVQKVQVVAATGGTFTLSFEGQQTAAIPFDASAATVQASLAALPAIGAGNVAVAEAASSEYLVTFTGALGESDVATLGHDDAGLEGGGQVGVNEKLKGFDGHVGVGELTDATGVGVYTYGSDQFTTHHYLFVADSDSPNAVEVFSGNDVRTLKLRKTIEGPGEGEEFEFGPSGSAVGVDPSNGHFYVYDAGHDALDEFEASGQFVDKTASPSFEDAEPSAIAVQTQQNEVQILTVDATGGSFKLEFEGEETTAISIDGALGKLSAAEVETALEALSALGPGNVAVHGRYIPSDSRGSYAISFSDALAADDVPQIVPLGESLSGSTHSAAITTATEGTGPGRLFLGAGSGPGAKLLAFGPLPEPGRLPLPGLSQVLKGIHSAAAVDSFGNVYVANSAFIKIFGPDGEEIKVGPEGKGIPAARIADLGVDSQGNVYGLDSGGIGGEETVELFAPASYPPAAGTQYGAPQTITTSGTFGQGIMGIGLDPVNDRLFVTGYGRTIEFDSAAEGSGVLVENFAPASVGPRHDVAICGASGNVYFASDAPTALTVVDPQGAEVLARVNGAGSPGNTIGFATERIDVDQSDCHVLFASAGTRGSAEEFDPAGAFVADFYPLIEGSFSWGGVAVDNGEHSPNRGTVYVAYDETAKGSFDLSAFAPLAYGEPPVAATGAASDFGEGKATLNGTVNPRGFAVEECLFEWGETAAYGHSAECEQPSADEIGSGGAPVSVHAEIAGLDPESSYHFRLVGKNKYGEGAGKDVVLGPPAVATSNAQPVLYNEATLRAQIDPVGLPVKYHFDYASQAHFEAQGFAGAQSTPEAGLLPGGDTVEVSSPLSNLDEGTTYRFRIVAVSEAGSASGAVEEFTTLAAQSPGDCGNGEYRTGLSAKLPDCRAYELTTPAQTRGAPISQPDAEAFFNFSLTPPRGEGAGEAIAFGSSSTLPGFDAVGIGETYRATRAPGAHPQEGWATSLISTRFKEAGGGFSHGGAPGFAYVFWFAQTAEEGTLPPGEYLRSLTGFEPTAQGELGTDLKKARSFFLSPGGKHVIFASKAHLEPAAAPEGTLAIYDRAAGSSDAEVISVKPDGSPFGAGEGAEYLGTSEDGTAVAFTVGDVLYVHRAGTTIAVVEGPSTFAGLSANGSRIFYTDSSVVKFRASLFVCELTEGPCLGGGGSTKIASDAIFSCVSADGSHVLFISGDALTPAGEGNDVGQHATEGEQNLYSWDGTNVRFVAILDSADFVGFDENNSVLATQVSIDQWTQSLGVSGGIRFRPARATPDGSAFVFQSHARLTTYDNEGEGEIYRYDPDEAAGRRLLCVSCDPSGLPPSADAMLIGTGLAEPHNLIPNLTDDGRRVFFESKDRLVPEDANSVRDVYEWRTLGVTGCIRPGGCLALISSGQGDSPSDLYSMSANGSDVFFRTLEKLTPADVADTISIYDARIDGGIPTPPEAAPPCRGDACQGASSRPPTLANSGGGPGGGNVKAVPAAHRCSNGRRAVRRGGKVHCAKQRHRAHKRRHHKGDAARRIGR